MESVGFLCLSFSLHPEQSFWIHVLITLYVLSGAKQTEASMTFRYNRQTMTLTSEMQIPDFDVDLGTVLRVSDESAKEETSYKLTLDIQNKKITEIALTGRIRYRRFRVTCPELLVLVALSCLRS